MSEEPVNQYIAVGWSNVQAALAMALCVGVGVALMVGLIYLRMGDVADALRQQAISCAQVGK